MTRIAYLDCPTGISGDMCLGALVDAGVPLDYLTQQLHRLGIGHEFVLRAEEVKQNGQRATKLHVDLLEQRSAAVPQAALTPVAQSHPPSHEHSHHGHDHGHHHLRDHSPTHSPTHDHGHPHGEEAHPHGTRHLGEIELMIQAAGLPDRPTQWSLAIFRQLAEAEGAVHGIAPEQVHFHEVGATDAIVDIVGTCLGLDWLNIDRLFCSALPTGGGTVWAAHGRIPVPAPAVLKLWELRQVPVYHNGIDRELVTPTGAAIATTLAVEFGPPPPMVLQRVGLGAGGRSLPIPNMVRLWLGTTDRAEPVSMSAVQGSQPSAGRTGRSLASAEAIKASSEPLSSSAEQLESVVVLETQVDDLNPQAIGYLYEALFAVGALDLYTQPVGMKKSRPGLLLTVICPGDRVTACEDVLFRETTTLGIRRSPCQRRILAREIQSVLVEGHTIRVKVARDASGQILNRQPEYEDCATVARTTQRPWRDVHQAALVAALTARSQCSSD